MVNVAVLGAGSWGTTLAKVFADAGNPVALWARRDNLASTIQATRENPEDLPGIELPAAIRATSDAAEGFYGFETKYLEEGVTASIPAPYSDELITQLQQMAVTCFHALDCKSLARVDFFVTDRGPVLNEVNTMPGFTAISMYPQVWAATGLEYPQLLDTLVRTALR